MSACSSLNTILFVSYLVLLIKNKNEKRERNRLAREIHDTLGQCSR